MLLSHGFHFDTPVNKNEQIPPELSTAKYKGAIQASLT